ncbi:MAG: hypothetical protein IJB85_06435 [Clostridia bacterium]|nr:hypothetical protein [Clostridia bacterium]
MAYRQPKVPEYREGEGVSRYLRKLALFLKDFSGAAWTANNQRIREIQSLCKDTESLSARVAALEADGKTEEA